MLHWYYSFLLQVAFILVPNCVEETNCSNQLKIIPVIIRSKHASSCSAPRTGFCHLPNIFLIRFSFVFLKYQGSIILHSTMTQMSHKNT